MCVSCIGRRVLYHWPHLESQFLIDTICEMRRLDNGLAQTPFLALLSHCWLQQGDKLGQRSLNVKNSDSETHLLIASESPHLTIIPGDSYTQASLGKLNYDQKFARCCC